MKLSNDVEKYEIEVTKMGQNYSFFLTVACSDSYLKYLIAMQVVEGVLTELKHFTVQSV